MSKTLGEFALPLLKPHSMSWGINIACSMDAIYECAIQKACHRASFLLTYSLLQPAIVRHATTQAQSL